jgi:hypothetical protein
MKLIAREDVLDYVTYNEKRDDVRGRIMELKKPRRVFVGEHLTFLFENTDTMLYQVQEMMRAEQIVREADITHEIATYNEVLGGPGELGCTLLIEIADPAERDIKLRAWHALPRHLYVKLESGELVRAKFDERQVGEERLSSVQYIKFDTKGAVPVAVGCSLPELTVEHVLASEQRKVLAEDLA